VSSPLEIGELMARPEGSVGVALGEVAAVERPGLLVVGVHVLEDVDLPGSGPVAPPEHPERRPVAQADGGIGLANGSGHGHLAAGRRAEVAAGRLDTPGRPGLAAAQCRDVEIPVTVHWTLLGESVMVSISPVPKTPVPVLYSMRTDRPLIAAQAAVTTPGEDREQGHHGVHLPNPAYPR
jgi:hypothetical protein